MPEVLPVHVTSKARLDALWREQHGHCWYCERATMRANATRDHVVPRSKNGSNGLRNTVMACRGCNILKGNKPTWKTKTPERLHALIAKAMRSPAIVDPDMPPLPRRAKTFVDPEMPPLPPSAERWKRGKPDPLEEVDAGSLGDRAWDLGDRR